MVKKNTPLKTSIKIELSLIDIFIAMIVWGLLTAVTLGLALLFFPYYYNKMVINRTYIVSEKSKKISKLENNLSFIKIYPHAALWLVIIILTLGIGVFYFLYYARVFVSNHTKIKTL